MFKPLGGMVALGDRMTYMSYETSDWEAARDGWTTAEQKAYNALPKTQCPACRGMGYKVYRQNGKTVREQAGCATCHGIGVQINE